MKRVVLACAVASLVVAGGQLTFGQGSANPFIDHSDTGETIHVLPAPAAIHSPHATQPSDAPAHSGASVFPPSYGSGDLLNHGGHQIPFAGFFAIYWNNAVASSAGSQGQPNLRTEVQNFVGAFSNAADYSIITQYSAADTISPVLAWAGDFVDSRAAQGSLSDSKVKSYIASLFNSGTVTADADTIYGVYFPSGMRITSQGGSSCSA